MPSHTSCACHQTATLAGLGFTNLPLSPSSQISNHFSKSSHIARPSMVPLDKSSIRGDLAPFHFSTLLSPILESPSMAQIQTGNACFEMPDPLNLDTPEDRSDPISQFIDAMRARASEYSFHNAPTSGVPHSNQISSSADSGQDWEESVESSHCDCEHCGEGYYATWEDDDDDYLDSEISSSFLSDSPDDYSAGADVINITSLYPDLLHSTPSSRVADADALRPFLEDLITPTIDINQQFVPSRFSSESGAVGTLFDEHVWAESDDDDDGFLTSYSTSSEFCPPTPPLSDTEEM